MGTTLSDSEKFKKVFEESNLNQARFAEKIGITPGSLSGIFNGRTNPTISMLRNLSSAFPDINPMWIFGDDENMHVGGHSVSAPETTKVQDDVFDEKGMEGTLFDFGPLGESAFKSQTQTPSSTVVQQTQKTTPAQSSVHTAPRVDNTPRTRQQTPAIDPSAIAASIALTSQKPPRKITEIRIFFDDGTYETFGPK